MRYWALVVFLLWVVSTAAGDSRRVIAGGGVRVTVSPAWHRVEPTNRGLDPTTLLVVGTRGVRPRPSDCQVAAYRVQPRGAVVVVIAWRTYTAGGGSLRPGRARLRTLRQVRRRVFECFSGRGAFAQVVLDRRVYMVSVMVGDRASAARVAEALAVGRSFALARPS